MLDAEVEVLYWYQVGIKIPMVRRYNNINYNIDLEQAGKKMECEKI